MKSLRGRVIPVIVLTVWSILMVASFQNCGPAVISGDSEAPGAPKKSTVGDRVDMTAVQNAVAEKSSNVLYPIQTTTMQTFYNEGAPIIENVVLNQNDFDRIEWIHSDSGIVLSNETIFQSRPFTNSLLGEMVIVGYRGTSMYKLGQIELAPKGTTALNINAVGAVNITQKALSVGSVIETFLVVVDAPAVDVESVRITNKSTGQVYSNQKALVFSKALAEKVDLEIAMTDLSGQSFIKTISFPVSIVTPALLPDLMVMSVTWTPASPVDGSEVRYYATVKNIGTGASPASTVMSLKFYVNDVLVNTSDLNSASLAPGASVTIAAATGPTNKNFWTAKVGTHTVTAAVDDENRILESSEINNRLNATIFVGAAPIPTTTTLPPPPPPPTTTTTTTLPTAVVTVPGSISAVDMAIKSTGKQEGTIWNLFSIGDVSNQFNFPTTGTHMIRVGAYGSVASGVWPNMEIRIDKVVVYAKPVLTGTLTTYTVAANVTAGLHNIEIGFTNDLSTATEDRNLYIGTVTVEPEAQTPTSLISNIAMRSDAANVYASFTYTGSITWPRLLIDSDQNIATGYAVAGIGADFLVENGWVYRYSGTSNSWTWPQVTYSGMVNTSPTVRWSFPRSVFGTSAAVHFVASVNQNAFSARQTHTLSTANSTTFAISDGPYLFNVNATSATVQWSLNMAGTGKVEYGTTTAFGSTSRIETTFNYSTHQQGLSGLTSKTTYYYRVVSTNQSGVTVMSPTLSFTTP